MGSAPPEKAAGNSDEWQRRNHEPRGGGRGEGRGGGRGGGRGNERGGGDTGRGRGRGRTHEGASRGGPPSVEAPEDLSNDKPGSGPEIIASAPSPGYVEESPRTGDTDGVVSPAGGRGGSRGRGGRGRGRNDPSHENTGREGGRSGRGRGEGRGGGRSEGRGGRGGRGRGDVSSAAGTELGAETNAEGNSSKGGDAENSNKPSTSTPGAALFQAATRNLGQSGGNKPRDGRGRGEEVSNTIYIYLNVSFERLLVDCLKLCDEH